MSIYIVGDRQSYLEWDISCVQIQELAPAKKKKRKRKNETAHKVGGFTSLRATTAQPAPLPLS